MTANSENPAHAVTLVVPARDAAATLQACLTAALAIKSHHILIAGGAGVKGVTGPEYTQPGRLLDDFLQFGDGGGAMVANWFERLISSPVFQGITGCDRRAAYRMGGGGGTQTVGQKYAAADCGRVV